MHKRYSASSSHTNDSKLTVPGALVPGYWCLVPGTEVRICGSSDNGNCAVTQALAIFTLYRNKEVSGSTGQIGRTK
jgi:hypothetical protein